MNLKGRIPTSVECFDMVSSPYSEAAFVTGVTPAKKFAPCQEKCKNFDFKVLQSIAHRLYRLRHGKLHNFEKNLDQNGLLWKKLEHFEIGLRKFLRSKNIQKKFIEIFHWKSSWNFFDVKKENVRSNKFSFPYNFQWKCSMFFCCNKPFWSIFFKICVDFQGGHGRTGFQVIGAL